MLQGDLILTICTTFSLTTLPIYSVDIPSFTETSLYDFNNKNGPEYVDDGLHGSKALLLTNLDDTMSLSSSRRFHENSISFWFKPEVIPKHKSSSKTAETKILLTGPGFTLHVNNKDELGIARQVTTTTKLSYDNYFEPPQDFVVDYPLKAGRWHQIGITLNENIITQYLNGTQTNRLNNSYLTNYATNQCIYLGKQNLWLEEGSIEYLPASGVVDDIRIFQGQLTSNQMYPLFAGVVPRVHLAQPFSRGLPSTGIKNLPFEELSFEWFPHPLINMVTDSSSFRFQLATDFEFHDLVEEKVLEKNLTTVTNLSPNTSYYWRVMMEDKPQEGESPIWEFRTKSEEHKGILTVMAFNVLGISPSGTAVAQFHGSEYAAEIIRNFTADLVSFPEGGLMCETVAGLLDFNYLKPDSTSRYNLCLLSRYPIVGQSFSPYYGSDKKVSSHVELPDGEIIEFTALHPRATDSGEVLTMMDISNEEAIEREFNARGGVIMDVLEDLNKQKDIKNMFIAGDLNSVSVLDFTEETSSIHNNRGEVEWPVTSMLRDAGFVDSYRTVHTDPMKDVGISWSYLYPPDPQGRLDFIFSRGDKFVQIASSVHFYHPAMWITDHNMVVSTFKINQN